jgi:hypothetical protein
MKSRKKNEVRKNKRWRWMAGATAATAAGVTTSQGGLVTINLSNNYISSLGNFLNADLTGDGNPDVRLTGAKYFLSHTHFNGDTGPYYKFSAAVKINGVYARGYDSGGVPFRFGTLGSQHGFASGGDTVYLTGSIPIFFKDLHINGGVRTKGFVEVTVAAGQFATIQLDSLTYNTPENDSSLGLLAMGASGILALRRYRKAQPNNQANRHLRKTAWGVGPSGG